MTRNNKQERKLNPPMKKLSNGIFVVERKPTNNRRSGTPIVFLHGSGFDSSVFNDQFSSPLLGHCHLIAMDLPGHGKSDNANTPQTDYSYASMGAKLLEALDLMGIDGAIFVGWSLGGQIAIEINHDDRVEGVFAFGVAPIAPGPMGMIRGFHFSRDLLLASKAQYTMEDAKRFEATCLGSRAEGRFVDAIMRTDPAFRPAISKLILKGQGLNQKKAVEAPQKPIALLQGENDPFIRTDYLKGLDSLGLFAKDIMVLEGCGHAPFMEARERFEHALLDFVEWVEINAFGFNRGLMADAKAA